MEGRSISPALMVPAPLHHSEIEDVLKQPRLLRAHWRKESWDVTKNPVITLAEFQRTCVQMVGWFRRSTITPAQIWAVWVSEQKALRHLKAPKELCWWPQFNVWVFFSSWSKELGQGWGENWIEDSVVVIGNLTYSARDLRLKLDLPMRQWPIFSQDNSGVAQGQLSECLWVDQQDLWAEPS